MLRGFLVCVICNSNSIHSQLQQYSFLYIHTLHDDFSHIEDVHLPFCAHFIFFLIFDGCWTWTFFHQKMLRGCLVFVICNSNSIQYFIFKLCLMVLHTLKMCTFYFVQISFFFTFLTDVELKHFQAVFIPLYSNFVLWLFTQWTCTPYIYAHLILYFWVFYCRLHCEIWM